jgi:membrane protein DedA with SNARE-associated domain
LLAALSLSAGICVVVPKATGETAVPVAVAASATNPAATAPATLAASPAASAPATQVSARAEQLRKTAERTRGVGTYITLFIILILSGLGLPLPEEIPLILAGYLASHESANLYILIFVGLAGALSSDFILFMATKRWRSHIFRWRWIRATIRPRHLVLARRQFHNHGLKIVIVARWLPALRTAICLTAGLTGVKAWRFMLVDATAACITVPTSILLGYYAGSRIDRLISGFERAEHIVLLTIAVAIVVALIVRFVWWRRTASPAKLVKPLPPHDDPSSHPEKIAGKHNPQDKIAG